jgi:NAD(P)-dependent dehydrogenase (short-subunit alcohol dehydrogenase family)
MSARKLAVITGGASGIGEATARRFAKDGYAVAILDQSKEAGAAGAKFITDGGGEARFYACDVADHKGMDVVAAAVERDMGPAAVLVTAAGLIPTQSPSWTWTSRRTTACGR